MVYTKQEHQEASAKIPRDAEGHFTHSSSSSSLADDIEKEVTISKTSDDNTLLDVHVGNPLKKITTLLEDIKKQKAFSFDIKGSLGIAGVVIVVTGLGIFGWVNTLVCSKGTQSFIGTIHELRITETPPSVPIIDAVINEYHTLTGTNTTTKTNPRIVLILQDNSVLDLILPKVTLPAGLSIVTGTYDTCHQTLTVTDTSGIEAY